MRRFIPIFIILLTAGFAPGNGKYSFLKPDIHGKAVKIQVKGKNYTYYRLDRKSPLQFTLAGPATIKVLTRLDMTPHKKGRKIDYKVFCEKDNRKTHFTRSGVAVKGVKLVGGKNSRIGGSKSFEIDLDEGNHKVILSLDKKSKDVVYIRLLKEGASIVDEPKRVALTPMEFTNQVKIMVKENEFDYYRVGSQDSLRLEVIGPATVKVLARLEYDVTMRGELKYRMLVFEDGTLKNTFILSTRLSDVTVYKEEGAEKRLARGESFYIEVPPGQHTYTFGMRDNGWTSLLKFYIPVKALDNKIR